MIDLSELKDIEFEHHLPYQVVLKRCIDKALYMLDRPTQFFLSDQVPSVGKLIAMLVRLEVEEHQKSKLLDSLVKYDDPIVSIEELDDEEMIDITVSGNNTFYANDILTKNSHGLSMTADLLISMIRTEELDEANQVLFKQLKNRFSDMASRLRFTVGIDRSKMTLYDNDGDIKTTQGGRVLSEGSPKAGGESSGEEVVGVKNTSKNTTKNTIKNKFASANISI